MDNQVFVGIGFTHPSMSRHQSILGCPLIEPKNKAEGGEIPQADLSSFHIFRLSDPVQINEGRYQKPQK